MKGFKNGSAGLWDFHHISSQLKPLETRMDTEFHPKYSYVGL